eukprot:1158480-Pelagomonas_calceolata.AAC.7
MDNPHTSFGQTSISDLPVALLHNILATLPSVKDITAFRLANRWSCSVVDDDSLWKQLVHDTHIQSIGSPQAWHCESHRWADLHAQQTGVKRTQSTMSASYFSSTQSHMPQTSLQNTFRDWDSIHLLDPIIHMSRHYLIFVKRLS